MQRYKKSACGYCQGFQLSEDRDVSGRLCTQRKKIEHVTALSEPCNVYTKVHKFYCLQDQREVDCIQCQWQRELLYFPCTDCYNFANDPPIVRIRPKRRVNRPRRGGTAGFYPCLERPDVRANKAMCDINRQINVEGCSECQVWPENKVRVRPRR